MICHYSVILAMPSPLTVNFQFVYLERKSLRVYIGFPWKWLVGTCSSVSYSRKSLYGNNYIRNHINSHQINTINSLWLVHISFLCVWKFNFRNFAIFPCSNFRIYSGKSLFEQFCISINVYIQVTCVVQLYTRFWWLNDR